MNKEFRLPDVGEGLTEADIVSWHVKPGDTVKVNQVIVEIETAKAVVELPSPYAGTVTALLVDEGQTVDVGMPIISVDVPGPAGPEKSGGTGSPPARGVTGGSAPGEQQSEPRQPDTGEPAPPARQPVLVGYGVKPGATTRRPRRAPATRPASYPPLLPRRALSPRPATAWRDPRAREAWRDRCPGPAESSLSRRYASSPGT